MQFIFDSVSGIETGSLVKLAGVEIGEVTNVLVIRDAGGLTAVQVSTRIVQGIEIDADAAVRVASSSLLGEKYIEITPSQSNSKPLPEGGVIHAKGGIGLNDLAAQGSDVLSKLDFAMDNVNEADPEFKSSVKGTFVNAQDVALNLKEASDDLKDAAKSARIVLGRLRDGEGTIGKLLLDDKIAKDLQEFVEDIKKHPWKLFKRY